MCKKLICLVSLIFVLGMVSNASAELVLHYTFDDVADGVVKDSSNGYDGTIGGDANLVLAKDGNGLAFAGAGWIDVPVEAWNNNLFDGFTICFWTYNDNAAQQSVPMTARTGSNGARNFSCHLPWSGTVYFDVRPASGNYQRISVKNTSAQWVSQWSHWTFVYTPGRQELYLNGELFLSGTGTGAIQQDTTGFTIGADNKHEAGYIGTIDDVRLYNNALTLTEIEDCYLGGPEYPRRPSPAVGDTDIPVDVLPSWVLGTDVDSQDVYFDPNEQAVVDGNVAPVNVTEASFDPGKLAFGTTYYWRVDAKADGEVYGGQLWNFETEPVAYPLDVGNISATASSGDTASSIDTVNQAGLDTATKLLHGTDGTEMWLSEANDTDPWIKYEFDKIYMLNQMQVWNHNTTMEMMMGFGIKEARIEASIDDVNYTPLAANVTFNPAPGTVDYAANTTVNLNVPAKFLKIIPISNYSAIGVMQYGLSEVSFTWIPALAREPEPDSGTGGLGTEVVLSWRAGRYADTHDVYLGTDEQAVADGTVAAVNVADAMYEATGLTLGQTYYWSIGEVNDNEDPNAWKGPVWNFSVVDYLVVDDMETSPETNWVPSGGASVAVSDIANNGSQSLALSYSGDSEISVSTANLAVGGDWTIGNPTTLGITFQGALGNDEVPMYAKISVVEGLRFCVITVPYEGDLVKQTRPIYSQWNIDLAALDVDLGNITGIVIGVGDGSDAAGVLYIDDIRLYGTAPAIPSEELWIEAEDFDMLTAKMKVSYDPEASGGLFIGTVPDSGDSLSNPPYPEGTATYNFDVAGGVYKVMFRVVVVGSNNALWVRINGATLQIPEDNIREGGWIMMDNIPSGEIWHWDTVRADEASGDPDVEYTMMDPGTYTLEIGYRESGAYIDAIVIQKID